jgi:hypothetical protein
MQPLKPCLAALIFTDPGYVQGERLENLIPSISGTEGWSAHPFHNAMLATAQLAEPESLESALAARGELDSIKLMCGLPYHVFVSRSGISYPGGNFKPRDMNPPLLVVDASAQQYPGYVEIKIGRFLAGLPHKKYNMDKSGYVVEFPGLAQPAELLDGYKAHWAGMEATRNLVNKLLRQYPEVWLGWSLFGCEQEPNSIIQNTYEHGLPRL